MGEEHKIIEFSHQLPKGTVLNNRYEIVEMIGEGGFGITYRGKDTMLDMPVAIKEYYPHGYANRNSEVSLTVTISGTTKNQYFEKWRDKYLQEARTLAKCADIPAIVTVRDFFEENGTAYIIMEFLNGITLKKYQLQNGPMDAQKLTKLMIPLLEALHEVHQNGLIHRDISPDNIMLMPDKTLKLFDFGAARNYSDTEARTLSVMLKPGYAPEEQYRSKGDQGPWTDVYAVCATMYKCITGVTPSNSLDRLHGDNVKKPSELGCNISEALEAVIMKGMNVEAEQRYQSAEELAEALKAACKKTSEPHKSPGKKLKAVVIAAMGVIAIGAFLVVLLSQQFTLTVKNGEGSGNYKAGAVVSVKAEERSGKVFSGWEISGLSIEEKDLNSNEIEIVMPRNTVELEAVYQDVEYTLSVIAGNGSGSYPYNNVVAVEADSPETGYEFQQWEVLEGNPEINNVESSVIFINMPAENVTIKAVYQQIPQQLAVDDFNNVPAQEETITTVYELIEHEASIMGGNGTGTYAAGDQVKIIANAPETGYEFSNWFVIEGEAGIENAQLPETSFIMPDHDVTIKAEYSRISYQLSVKESVGSGEYFYGDQVILAAEDKTGYTFTGWKVDKGELTLTSDELAAKEIAFKMPAQNVSLTAVYQVKANDANTVPAQEETMTPVYELNKHGAFITRGSGTGRYAVGDQVKIIANVPETGYEFSKWSVIEGKAGIENSELPETSFIMPDHDVTIKAEYSRLSYQLSVKDSGGSGEYFYGDLVTLTAENKAGYTFNGWKVDKGELTLTPDELAQKEITFKMPDQDITIQADYIPMTYSLVVKNGQGSRDYYYGEKVTITAGEAGENMIFSHWTVDQGMLELSDSSIAEVTFDMPPEELIITAHYNIIKKYVSVINGKGNGSYEIGSEVEITAETVDNSGNPFDHWSVEKGSLKLEKTDITKEVLSFIMPACDLTIKANYKQPEEQIQKNVYVLKVNGGTGGGTYEAGTKVTVQANTSDPDMTFVKWFISGYTDDIPEKNSTIEITMPENDVEITALFQSIN